VTHRASEIDRTAKQALLAAPTLRIRENRIGLLDDITSRMKTVIEERGEEMATSCELCHRPAEDHPWEEEGPPDKDGKPTTRRCRKFRSIAGGHTGLIVRKRKAGGFEYAVDTPLLSEIREHAKHVAVEMGEWQETVMQPLAIQIVCPQAPNPAAMPRVVFDAAPVAEDDDDDTVAIGIQQK
jgi:hypothetical protein